MRAIAIGGGGTIQPTSATSRASRTGQEEAKVLHETNLAH